MQIPWMQEPWLEQVGSMHWPSSTLHSAPFHPARHTHLPFSYTPLPLHNTGHESATGQTQITATYSVVHTCKHTHTRRVLQYISWETAVTYREWGYALLSQRVRGFSKSSSSLCLPLFLSHTRAHTGVYTHSSLSLTLFQFTQAPPEPGYHGNPGIVENPPNVTSLALNRPWKQSWKRKIRKESIRGL